MKILNLGAGNEIKHGDNVDNHDLHAHRPEINIVWDLDKVPWSCFPNNTYDQIYARDVFEHLQINLIQTLNECWRIAKPNGVLYIKYPLYTSPRIHDDPTHRWAWSDKVLHYFDPDTEYGSRYGFYTPFKWHIEDLHTHKDLSCHARLRKL